MEEVEIVELFTADHSIITTIENYLAQGSKISLVVKKSHIALPDKIHDSDSNFRVHLMSIDHSQFEVPGHLDEEDSTLLSKQISPFTEQILNLQNQENSPTARSNQEDQTIKSSVSNKKKQSVFKKAVSFVDNRQNQFSQKDFQTESLGSSQINQDAMLHKHFATTFQKSLHASIYYKKLKSILLLESYGQIKKCKNQLQEFLQQMDQLIIKQKKENTFEKRESLIYSILLVIHLETSVYLGIICTQLGLIYDASRYYEKCVRHYQIQDDFLLSKLQLRAGQVQFLMLNFQKALDHFQQALALQEKNQWKIEMANSMLYIALIYAHLGFIEESKKISFAALSILKEKLEQKDSRIGYAYHTLGEIYNLSSENESALGFLEMALDIKYQHQEEASSIVLTLNKMGNILHKMGDRDQALRKYIDATELIKNSNSLMEAQILNNLGLIFIDLGDKEKAKEVFQKCLRIYLAFFDENHSQVKRTLKNLQMLKKNDN